MPAAGSLWHMGRDIRPGLVQWRVRPPVGAGESGPNSTALDGARSRRYNRESWSMSVEAEPARSAGSAPDGDVPRGRHLRDGEDVRVPRRLQELTKALADEGIVSAFPIQALTVADALAGRDVCGKAKTGSGKTLAFGVPLLQRAKATREARRPRPSRPAGPAARPRAAPDPRAGRAGARRDHAAGPDHRAAHRRRLRRGRHRPPGHQAPQGRRRRHRHARAAHRPR